MHESEKARLERIMSEFAPDSAEEARDRAGFSQGVGRRIGEEELLAERGRRERGAPDIQKGVLRIKQLIRDELAYQGMTMQTLATKTGLSRPFLVSYFGKDDVDIAISTLVRIAHALNCEVRVWFEEIKEPE